VLIHVLRMIANGEAASVGQLATELAIEANLVRHMLDELVCLGYLQPSGAGCPLSCRQCTRSDACSGLSQMWVLTEKGGRAVRGTRKSESE